MIIVGEFSQKRLFVMFFRLSKVIFVIVEMFSEDFFEQVDSDVGEFYLSDEFFGDVF